MHVSITGGFKLKDGTEKNAGGGAYLNLREGFMLMCCYYCDESLGSNRVLESSQTGSHVVFSSARKRVWFACEQCGRWNLTDQTYLADLLLQCERHYLSAKNAVVFGGVGQVMLDGLKLTRVDDLKESEFLNARHTMRVRRRSLLQRGFGIAIAASSAILIWSSVTLFGGIGGALIGGVTSAITLLALNWIQQLRHVNVPLTDGSILTLTRGHAAAARLVEEEDNTWGLRVRTVTGVRILHGADAFTTISRILSLFEGIAQPAEITSASNLLLKSATPDAAILQVIKNQRPTISGQSRPLWFITPVGTIRSLPTAERLMIEMIATEQHERNLLAVDVSSIKLKFDEATEIAEIIEEFFPLDKDN